MTLPLGDGNHQLTLAFGSHELWLIFAGVVLMVIAWIMGEAALLAEENKSFV